MDLKQAVQQVRKLQVVAERDILAILNKLEEQTGVAIPGVNIDHSLTIGQRQATVTQVRLNISL